MTHPLRLEQPILSRSKNFQNFIFINDSSLTPVRLTQQLHDSPDKQFLSQTDVGSYLIIKQIYAPRNIVNQLNSLQFKPNQRVRLVSKTNTSSTIVDLNGKLIGMGAKIAQRIVVTTVEETNS